MEKKQRNQFAVLGLGRFGMSVVKTLSGFDVSVLACDRDPIRLHEAADYATHAIQADVLDEVTLEKLGLGNFDVVVIAMADDFEASMMATMIAKEQGAKHILVKANGLRQKRILENIGADQIVLPETEMGARIAKHLVDPDLLDLVDESEHFSLYEMSPHKDWIDKTIRQSDIRERHRLTILAIKRDKRLLIPVYANETIRQGDILVILGERP